MWRPLLPCPQQAPADVTQAGEDTPVTPSLPMGPLTPAEAWLRVSFLH